MRYIALIVLVCTQLMLFAQSQQQVNNNGYNTFYYDNGKVSSEGPMRDGKPDGYWKTYSSNGNIKSEGNRKNFMLDSIWKFYNEQGVLAMEYSYKDGKKTGLKKTFDTKEKALVLSENFDADVKQGNTINYFKPTEAGGKAERIKQIIPYVDGKEEGSGLEFAPDSTIITLTDYKMGFIQHEEKINRKDAKGLKQGAWKEFYPNGVLKKEVTYFDDKMHGYLKEYSPTGSLLNTTKYVNGVIPKNAPELAKLDVKTEVYDDGKLHFMRTYKEDVAEGTHREFSPEGKIIDAKIYVEGVLTAEGVLDSIDRKQGMWKEFYPDGKIKSVGEYLDGKRVGDWVFYYSNEKTEQKGTYDRKGKAQGVWKWFYESGNLLKEENYRNGKVDGSMIEYSDSGKVITKGDYVDGQKEGPWMFELRDYREEGVYKEDKRDGEWKHYYTDNNKLRFVGKFVDGTPEGVHIFYYPDGKEKQVGKYEGGQKEGEWKFYDETGFLFLSILYKDDIELKFDGIKVVPETVADSGK